MKGARSWIQYHRTRGISPPPSRALYGAVSMTFRAIIPPRIRKTDATNERSVVRINRERLSVSTAFPARPASRCALLFLFLAHKKRSHRREVTYGIAYYTGIIPAGPIWDFSASLWPALPLPLLFSLTPLCRSSSSQSRNT